jgi:hypothetical protein
MNLVRQLKGWIYSQYPSSSAKLHEKRRKGLFYLNVSPEILVCQKEQDRIFWEKFLHPQMGGVFWEVGAGDGVVGSHTSGLEIQYGWSGILWEPTPRPRERAMRMRKCRVLGAGEETERESVKQLDLLAIHRPEEFPAIWERLDEGLIAPQWVIVENAQPDPKWCCFLKRLRYELRFFFHDDEYYELQA